MRHSLLLAISLVLLAGCKKKEDVTGPSGSTVYKATQLVLVQGDTQTVQASTLLPVPIIIRALDADGHAASGTNVQFVVGGGGTVSPPSVATDSLGQVGVKWQLGPVQPSQTLTAATIGVTPIVIHATAIFPTSVTVVQGANQVSKSGVLLPVPIVVRVTGPNNVPMVGINVAIQVSNAGVAAPASGVTDASGQISFKWTLGFAAGSNSLTVNAGTLPTVLINATGN